MLFVTTCVFVRYVPQVYFDLANRKRRVIVKVESVARAWYILSLYVLIFTGFLLRFKSYSDSGVGIILGLSVFSMGIGMGLAGLLSMNKFYCERLVIFEGSQLITSGIYAIVRHPMRIGLFLELLGIVVLSSTTLLFVPLLTVFVLQWTRTNEEELLLKDVFGEAERKYISSVPKFNFILGFMRYVLNRLLIKTAKGAAGNS
jgi:protein-S-isoprenylcysteine O-methyltransferase Ste14